MSQQIISWSLFIVPWLTLFFMKRADIRRYIPAALFTIVTSTIIYDIGIKFEWWVIHGVPYPFYLLQPFLFGLLPVMSMWLLHFTYGRFGMYMVTNLVFDIAFAYFFLGYFTSVNGILSFAGMNRFQNLLLTLGHAVILYVYQMSQEEALVSVFKNLFSRNLQPAATKPLLRNNDDKSRK